MHLKTIKCAEKTKNYMLKNCFIRVILGRYYNFVKFGLSLGVGTTSIYILFINKFRKNKKKYIYMYSFSIKLIK